jgi:hypothetical protein
VCGLRQASLHSSLQYVFSTAHGFGLQKGLGLGASECVSDMPNFELLYATGQTVFTVRKDITSGSPVWKT